MCLSGCRKWRLSARSYLRLTVVFWCQRLFHINSCNSNFWTCSFPQQIFCLSRITHPTRTHVYQLSEKGTAMGGGGLQSSRTCPILPWWWRWVISVGLPVGLPVTIRLMSQTWMCFSSVKRKLVALMCSIYVLATNNILGGLWFLHSNSYFEKSKREDLIPS